MEARGERRRDRGRRAQLVQPSSRFIDTSPRVQYKQVPTKHRILRSRPKCPSAAAPLPPKNGHPPPPGHHRSRAAPLGAVGHGDRTAGDGRGCGMGSAGDGGDDSTSVGGVAGATPPHHAASAAAAKSAAAGDGGAGVGGGPA